jgi:predicted nucleic acid-binding protein
MAGIEDLSPEDQRLHRAGALLLKGTPEIAKKAKRLLKEAKPDLQIPEVEMEDAVAAAEGRANKRVEELEAQMVRERAERRHSERVRQLKELGLDQEKVEKLIKDHPNWTYDDAIAFATMERQTAEPTAGEVVAGSVPHLPIELRPDKDWRKLQGNDLRRHSANIASEMITANARARRAGAR